MWKSEEMATWLLLAFQFRAARPYFSPLRGRWIQTLTTYSLSHKALLQQEDQVTTALFLVGLPEAT